mgnify:CR=1 FL=1
MKNNGKALFKLGELQRYIEIAYKKLKNNIFFDKSNVITRNALVEFENSDQWENKLKDLADSLIDCNKWVNKENEILDDIKVITLPKTIDNIVDKVKNNESTDKQKSTSHENVIFNKHLNEKINIKDFQYMIDMPIEGHILGVLWILLIGRYLDEDGKMYKHSYGNRLRKNLFKKGKNPTYYPGMFEPYFSQYTAWRDNGIDIAREHLDKGDDIIILTMDLQRYYYSVNYQEKEFVEMFNDFKSEHDNMEFEAIGVLAHIHSFVFKVIQRYSCTLRSECKDEDLWVKKDSFKHTNNVLPIGFLPSCILANYRLNVLDQQINSRWNPLYYGRYVDDIIIVDKVEKNSELYKLIYDQNTEASNIIELYLTNCNAKKCEACFNQSERALFCRNNIEHNNDNTNADQNIDDQNYYYLNPEFLKVPVASRSSNNIEASTMNVNGDVYIKVQNKKVRLFVFNSGSSDMLLRYFQNEILRNSSEFRFLAPADTVYSVDAYCKIFDVNYSDSINKISSLKDIGINKFELSKFLGKQMSISMLTDSKANPNICELLKLMVDDTLIANYMLWERILEILVLRHDSQSLLRFTQNIVDSLSKLSYKGDASSDKAITCSKDLVRVFYSDLCRVMALSWGSRADRLIKDVCKIFCEGKLAYDVTNFNEKTKFNEENIFDFRKQYCYSRMLNKFMLPLCLESIIDNLHKEIKSIKNESKNEHSEQKHKDILLFNFKHSLSLISENGLSDKIYYYSPTVIKPQELKFSMYTAQMLSKNNSKENYDEIYKLYALLNYHYVFNNESTGDDYDGDRLDDFITIFPPYRLDKTLDYPADKIDKIFVAIKGEAKKKLRVAIANTKIDEKYFEGVLKDVYDRSLERYEKLEEILRMAVKEKVDMIVFPECYLPYEWLPRLYRFSATNKIAVISGIEIIALNHSDENSFQKDILNLTAVILPYQINNYRFAYMTFHEKIHFSPEEQRMVANYSHFPREGKTLQMFYWHDVFFSVYCCFEIASISLRSAFENYLDLFIAVECNKDINYFSNVMESLCRDLHCYCLQVNSSNYGDSRLIKPASSALMNMMRIKGGRNEVILVEDIDIDGLRNFQRKKYELQRDEKDSFKTTPPGFDISIVDAKLHKRFLERIQEELRME